SLRIRASNALSWYFTLYSDAPRGASHLQESSGQAPFRAIGTGPSPSCPTNRLTGVYQSPPRAPERLPPEPRPLDSPRRPFTSQLIASHESLDDASRPAGHGAPLSSSMRARKSRRPCIGSSGRTSTTKVSGRWAHRVRRVGAAAAPAGSWRHRVGIL